ncbi:hypothetical protein PENTCL1PPCAC_1629, partial [Pristionchus entomophagus]
AVRRARKREPEINLSELLWALEDDVIERRRAKSEPPIRACRQSTKFLQMHMEISLESALEASLGSSSAEVTWSERNEVPSSKKAKRNKRRKIRENGEKMEESIDEQTKSGITVIVDEEAPSIYMTPPKSPDHEVPCTTAEARQRLLDTVNEYRSQASNKDAISLISQLAQMAYCYNKKERPGITDYDNMHELVQFYTEAPQIRDPCDATDHPSWFIPQKMYLMRRQVRERLYGAVSLLRSQQTVSIPVVPEEYKNNSLIMNMIHEATALGRNCHTLAMLLEDLHSIPDL